MDYPIFAALTGVQRPAVSPEVQCTLTREILRTDILRIKALIATATIFVVALTIAYLISPDNIQRLWRGHFELELLYSVYLAFVAFEVTVLLLATRQLRRDLDVPHVRRYLGALVKTSLPTFALYVQINYMGARPALGFVAPLVYFIFIILSTLRLDFWLSTFTGAVGAIELLAVATLHPAISFDVDDRRLTGPITSVEASSFCLAACLLGRWESGCECSSRRASPRPRPETASPTCSASMSRRRSSSAC